MIESAPHQMDLPMGVFSVRIPAIRLRGISVQHAIHVVQIIDCKPLQHVPLATILAHAFAATNVLLYHSDPFAVDALPPRS
jgi:hypothetical protein